MPLNESLVSCASIYSEEQLQMLAHGTVPKHIAIIPDGNRRWARKNGFTVMHGYQQGADNLIDIVKASKELGIQVVTFYGFSTENWDRDFVEVKALLWLIESYLIEQRPVMIENGVKFETIGDLSRFSKSFQGTIQETKRVTEKCNGVVMVLGLNYGARNEICRAVKNMLQDLEKKILTQEVVTETVLSHYLDTMRWPDPELVVRTGGENRLSNFLLWQASYAELHIADIFWPEFTPQHLLEVIVDFQRRERRLGR